MSWSKLSINTPGSIPEISQHVNVLAVSPWTHGVKEGSGNHTLLPFPSAIEALSEFIGNPKAVFAIAISAPDLRNFKLQLAALYESLGFKEFERLHRHASSLLTLEQDKFELVDLSETKRAIALNAIPPFEALSKLEIETAARNEALEVLKADPLANLTAFESSLPEESKTPIFSGGSGWRFYADSDIKSSLKVNQKSAGYKYTAIVAFVGNAEDLIFLRELMP